MGDEVDRPTTVALPLVVSAVWLLPGLVSIPVLIMTVMSVSSAGCYSRMPTLAPNQGSVSSDSRT